ncbi:tumor protein p53-inducible protein 11 isoform X2 [Parasteatoda tepidariorum]|uniref:tumor protein p53-inducible protein 11 isoform X2 n=1 Tax=Parasteatoda tepidariorum TaxID=114398 RepID=UPI00077F9B5F|nr:tumor protein p53-inducible protein 11 isoform X2 [Parasteatoda tepidariorum]
MPNFNSMEALCEPEVYVPYRKHSSGDLQSRLKTRKILGVGETDNGDVHRSKISQVLGHNEHLFVRFPRCYWWWHFLIAAIFTANGLHKCFLFLIESEEHSSKEYVTEAMHIILGFSLLLWRLLGTTDKSLARALMLSVVVSQLAQFYNFIRCLYQNRWDDEKNLNMYLSPFLLLGCAYFFWAMGSSRAGLRRSLSNKDLRDRQPTPEDQQPLTRQQPEQKKNE